MSKMKCKRLCVMLTLSLLLVCMMGTTAFAAGTGDVAGAVESTWATASTQIKTVVNNVVFPAIDLILAVFFFAKLGTAYFDYRKSGQFEWTAPAILFACLVFTLTVFDAGLVSPASPGSIFAVLLMTPKDSLLGVLAAILAVFGIGFMIPVLGEYFRTGLVPRFPTLIVCCFVLVAALLLFISGIILSSQLAKDARDFEFQLQTVHHWHSEKK